MLAQGAVHVTGSCGSAACNQHAANFKQQALRPTPRTIRACISAHERCHSSSGSSGGMPQPGQACTATGGQAGRVAALDVAKPLINHHPSLPSDSLNLSRRHALSSALATTAVFLCTTPAAWAADVPSPGSESVLVEPSATMLTEPLTGLALRMITEDDLRSPGNMVSLWEKPGTILNPRWLFGEWAVASTFTKFRAPLGDRFVGAGLLAAAQAPVDQGGLGSTLQFQARFYSTLPDTLSNQFKFAVGMLPSDAIIADRAFNLEQATDAALGYAGAVANISYDTRAPDKLTVEYARLSPDMRPLPPRLSEIYILNSQSEAPSEDTFITSELFRQVSTGGQSVAVQDYEVLTSFTQVQPGVVTARQRTVMYLQPNDPLFFQAFGRATAVSDYQLSLTRAPAPEDALGAIACAHTPKGYIQCL
mmetsp:Transcript_7017/g.11933  ORF Transcript_7017/g.11933 Transcript_7017/m.11933 type:complete len:421 (+) Transcript_7017:308-1570(+)